jgi:hypothetical protein
MLLRLDFMQAVPPVIGHLRALRTLRLDNNQLTTLPPEIGFLVHLQLLDASHNEISTLPLQLGGCIQLQFLNLLDNPLTVSAHFNKSCICGAGSTPMPPFLSGM